jgi:hypothetical protein
MMADKVANKDSVAKRDGIFLSPDVRVHGKRRHLLSKKESCNLYE